MPPNYYTRIMNYTGNKPLVFSEIGWTSSQLLRGGSEQEQVEYLLWFLEHTKTMPLEIVSWLCLHDLRTVEEETNPNAMPNDYLGLKYKNGTEKPVWTYWQTLHALSYQIPEFPTIWAFLLSLMLVSFVAVSLHKRKTQPLRKKTITNTQTSQAAISTLIMFIRHAKHVQTPPKNTQNKTQTKPKTKNPNQKTPKKPNITNQKKFHRPILT